MWKSPWLYRLVFVACLLPLLVLAWKWYHQELGVNRIEFVARYTGRWTLRLLLITLAITPLRRIPGLGPLIRFRRTLGLFTFFYGVLHGLHYFGIDAQWNMQVIVEDLTFRRFFIAGAIALLLMTPLALTSSDAAIRRMGGKRWQRLHRLIYLSAIAAVIHYAWQGKALFTTPLIYAGIVAVLLATRVLLFFLDRRKASRRNTRARPIRGLA
jgi:sulfoxide reductase heme-binding subunit YedZ